MRIMRTLSVVERVEPVVRCSSCLMRESRLLMTSFNCLSSSSTKPMIANWRAWLGRSTVLGGRCQKKELWKSIAVGGLDQK